MVDLAMNAGNIEWSLQGIGMEPGLFPGMAFFLNVFNNGKT